jgi:UvrD-like helicase family protein
VSYGGVYVDEYQDCSVTQHELVVQLSSVLPTRVIGDPMQGIFEFAGPTVDWATLDEHFEPLGELVTPHRWRDSNPRLGEWLTDARSRLVRGEGLDLSSDVITIGPATDVEQVRACHRSRGESSVVAIRKWAGDVHAIARRLGGAYVSMEEIDSKELFTACRDIESASGCDRALRVVEFGALCMTKARDQLSATIARLRRNEMPVSRRGASTQQVVAGLRAVAESDGLGPVRDALRAMSSLPGVRVFRSELVHEMDRALLMAESSDKTLEELAWSGRNQTRYAGRRVDARIVSRTLLVKGLEFDHAIVLKADELDAKNLYVAITRPRKSLTVLIG